MTVNPALSRRRLLLLASGYLLFVVYGSLVPLDFKALPFAEAVMRFRAIPYLSLGIGSRADWVANILLFIPLSFLWMGVLWHPRRPGLRVVAVAVVLACAVALSIGIEFTQLFFPPRTVSQNDIIAETIGAIVGAMAWWLGGPRLFAWLAVRQLSATQDGMDRRPLYVFLVILFAYNLLPLDLTISPVEIFHKFRENRLVLIPFYALPLDPGQAAYEILSDIAIWLPAGLFWRLETRSTAKAIRNTVLAALLLEFLQIWVFSRVTDVTDVITAIAGGWLGAMIAVRWLGRQVQAPSARAGRAGDWVWPVVVLIVVLTFIAGVFWYPFDFNTDTRFVRERLILLKQVPFSAYYFGSEFRAVTEVFHKVLIFAPLGVWAGWIMMLLRWPRLLAWLMGTVFVACVAAIIEVGQLALPRKNADLTDWGLETGGALLGLWLAMKLARTRDAVDHRERRQQA